MFVKICGITSEEDALLAVAMGADALGFVFAPSTRQITPEKAGDIVKRLPPEIMTVGVFRNEEISRMTQAVIDSGVRAVQLHGDESVATTQSVKEQLRRPIIKAVAAGSRAMRSADQFPAEIVLLDAPSPGSGQVFDWRMAEGVPDVSHLVLAGGLNPDNVIDAIEAVRPWGVDVSSGVETKPGIKDPTKVRLFIERANSGITPKPSVSQTGPYDWEYE